MIFLFVDLFIRYWKTRIEGAKSGKLVGKTVAIKDTIMVAGVPMMNGCRALEGYTADTDATVITRILDAGMMRESLIYCNCCSFVMFLFVCFFLFFFFFWGCEGG